MPFFDASRLPEPGSEYVAWIDVMGIQSAMARSLRMTANFVFKLHVAALEAPTEGVRLYPVMDGLYAASASRAKIEAFMDAILVNLATHFLDEKNPLYRFVVKGALAFGPVVHGTDVPAASSKVLADSKGYSDQILLGLPMVQAHQGEKQGPPFGIFVHESARTFSPPDEQPFHSVWWRWPKNDVPLRGKLASALDSHYIWCSKHTDQLHYDADRIAAHARMAKEYLEEAALSG